MSKVIIAGGGVIGLCSAYYARKAGHEVTVIERGDISGGTSFGNAGYVSPSHFVPLASPGIIAKGLRWMLSSTSPFYIKPRLSLDLIRWGLTFWKQSNRHTVEQNVPHLHAILQLSRHLQSELKQELTHPFLMEEIGCFMLYQSHATEQHERELAEEAAGLGIETRILTGKEVQDMEPDVEVNTLGGVLYPIDCHIHPGQFMESLHHALKDMGAKMQLNTNITGFERKGKKIQAVITDHGRFEADEVVMATGSWSPETSGMLGINMILQPGKGYSMTFDHLEKNLKYPAILVDKRVAMTPFGDSLRMGGTMEISGLHSPTLVKRAQAIMAGAKAYYPKLDVAFPGPEKIWHGYRPLSPDGLPYLGRHSKYENLVVASGHAMIGITLAAATGKIVEELVSRTPTSIDISGFDVERYG
ncbi:MAG: NAD(P)/FAD-dependent oxidoreductase [Chitinophagaceae bacterium]